MENGKRKSEKRSSSANELKKNDEVTVDITGLGNNGEGIGRTGGFTLFIKGAVPGDRILCGITRLKKNYGYARVIKIISSSPDRTEPVCPAAGKCGGCSLQHMTYESQLRWKEKKVYDCITRIGGFRKEDFIYEPIFGMKTGGEMPVRYRNKGQFPVGSDSSGRAFTGFYAQRSHRIVPTEDCIIQDKCTSAINRQVIDIINRYSISVYDENTHKGLVRHIVIRTGRHTGEIMVCIVINGDSFPHGKELVSELTGLFPDKQVNSADAGDDAESSDRESAAGGNYDTAVQMPGRIVSIVLNINKNPGNKIMGEKNILLYGREYINDMIGDLVFRISPLSFFQVNSYQTEALYRLAMEYADIRHSDIVYDLYCGTGTLSLFAAQNAARVIGVEIVEQAVKDARVNACENGINNAQFITGAAESVIPDLYRRSGGKLNADVVILDPPRKGCDEKLISTVAAMKPARVVYVSCDPATFARDCRRFAELGYFLKKARACDMFALTAGVETVGLLAGEGKRTDIGH